MILYVRQRNQGSTIFGNREAESKCIIHSSGKMIEFVSNPPSLIKAHKLYHLEKLGLSHYRIIGTELEITKAGDNAIQVK